MSTARHITDGDYRQLLELRTALRRFLHWSTEQAESAGLTAAQHQLLLAIRGHDAGGPPTIGELADHLLLKHHSTVQLIDRAEAGGWVRRSRDEHDHRVVRVALTAKGERALGALAAGHLEELRRVRDAFSWL